MNLKVSVSVFIEKDGDGYYAYAPALKGLHVGGDTLEEAIQNARDGVDLYLTSLLDHNEPLPIGEHLKIEAEPERAQATVVAALVENLHFNGTISQRLVPA